MTDSSKVLLRDFLSDSNTNTAKTNLDSRNRQTKHDLISLAAANSYQIRVLAVRNLKYYPEHVDILIALLRTESHTEVLGEIESSIISLISGESNTTFIEEKLESTMEKLVEGEPAFYVCRSLLNNHIYN